MYRYKAGDVMDAANLSKLAGRFAEQHIPRFERLERYYRVKNDIMSRPGKDGKPNNLLAHGYAKYITKIATGYFMGKPVRYGLGAGNGEYKALLAEILDSNYTDSSNFEVAKEASKKGIAYEILYIDEESRLRTKKLDAEEVIPVYSPSLGEFLECAVRLWHEAGFDGSVTEWAALYTKAEVTTYSRPQAAALYTLADRRPHGFDDVPVIVYWNNEERAGDYEDVISLIDAYDKGQSDTANDSEYFADAYFYIVGANGGLEAGGGEDGGDSAYRTLRREKMLFLDEHGQAGFITKNINDAAEEHYKDRLRNDIFFVAQVPALSDESFAGNLTGVALRYKLVGLEELTTEKEQKFLAAQKKKLRLITGYINRRYNKSFNADGIEIKTARNFIDNTEEAIKNAGALEGVTSKETQLGLLPFVEDAAEEMERIKKEAEQEKEAGGAYEGFAPEDGTEDAEDEEEGGSGE